MKVKHIAHNVLAVVLAVSLVAGSVSIENIFADEFNNIETNTPTDNPQGGENPEPTPVEPTTPVENPQGDENPEPTPVEPTTPVENPQGDENPEPTPVEPTTPVENPQGGENPEPTPVVDDIVTEKFTVTFLGFEDAELSVQEVADISEIEIPEAPEVEGYTFISWDCEVSELELTEDTTIKAVYEQLFTVTFLGFEDVELSVQEVTSVDKIEIPEIPAVKGKQFDKWSVDLTELAELEEDLTIKAEYVDYELVEKTLTKELFDREFIVSGNMPEGTELVVKKVTNTEEVGSNIEESCGGSVKARVIEAYDITLLVDEIEYQPSEFDEAVTVTIKKVNIEKKDTENIEVFHIDGDNNAEPVTADVSDEAVIFTASSFSVYVIADVTYNTDDGTLLDNGYATAYLYDDGTLLVTEFKQNGTLNSHYPWYSHRNDITKVEFADTVTFISDYAFAGDNITGTLTIPDSVITIGKHAFAAGYFTGTLTIPDSVITIGDSAFSGCTTFTGTLTIGNSVQTIGDNAFAGLVGINNVQINSQFTYGDDILNTYSDMIYTTSNWDEVMEITVGTNDWETLAASWNRGPAIKYATFNSTAGVFDDDSTSKNIKMSYDADLGKYYLTSLPEDPHLVVDYPIEFHGWTSGNALKVVDGKVHRFSFNGSGLLDNGVMYFTDSITFNAIWAEGKKINLYANGGAFDSSVINKSTDSDGEYTIYDDLEILTPEISTIKKDVVLPEPTRSGYTFRGWYMNQKPSDDADLSSLIGCKVEKKSDGYYYVSNGNVLIPVQSGSSTPKIYAAWESAPSYTLLDNEYATAHLYDDKLVVIRFKQNGSVSDYPWYPYKNNVPTLELADTVTFIGNEAFNGYKAFSGTLTIPDSVETIGNSAFKGCTGFTGSLVIPNSVKTIGDHAFEGTNGFTDNLVISDSVETIGAYAFSNCSGFKGTLTLGNSVQTIGDRAFYCDSKLTGNLVIPDSVITIGDYAFYGLKGFTGSPTIGNSVETIGAYAFASCTGFTGNLVISNSVKTIGEYAFNNCTGLTGTLTLGNSLKTIGKQAFSGDLFTGALIIPNSVETIGESAFYMNNKFNALTLGNSVKSIDNFAFFLCAGFKGNLVIPNSVETIGNNVFFSCTGFDGTINLGTGVKTIGNAAFAGLKNVTGTLVIPASVESMGNYAFQNMNKINEVQINSQFTYGDKILYVKPEDKIDTTSNWDEIMSTTAGTDDWETLATSWNRFTPATYTVTFNADGGTPVPAAQAIVSGQTATEPTAPTKTGYTFKGWFSGSTEFDFNTPITGAITLKAKWEELPDLSGYLILDANGGKFSNDTTSKDISSSLVSKNGSTTIYESLYDLSSEIPTRDGYHFVGWFIANYNDDSRDLVYNYKVINNSEDGYIVYEKSTDVRISVIKTVSRSGISEPVSAKTIKAGWIKKQYTLFDAGNGTFSNGEHTTTLETEYEAFINGSTYILQYSKGLPDEEPTLEGYEFLGWRMVIAGDQEPSMTDYPLGPGYHNVRATVNSDGRLDKPEDAGRDILPSLNAGGTITSFNNIEGNLFKCQAMWGGIQYDAYGGTFTDGSTIKTEGINPTPHYDTTDPSYPNVGEYFYVDDLISEIPTREGYTFLGWAAASGDENTFSIYHNYEYPDYIKEWGSKYQLTHKVFKDTDGILKIRNDSFNIYTGVVTKRDNDVQQLTLDSNVYNSAFCSTLFLKAIWEPIDYTVTFDADGGTPVPTTQTIVDGQKATEPTAPTKEGYTFKGWFIDSTEFDFNTPITENVALKAKWETNTYTVAFDVNGGTQVPTAQIIAYGQKATEPTAPIRTGYTFKGWYKGSTEFDFDTPITGNTILRAKWEQNRVEEPTPTPEEPTPTPEEPTPSPEEEPTPTPEEPTPSPEEEPTPTPIIEATPTPSEVPTPTPTPKAPERNEEPTPSSEPSSEPEDDPQPYVISDEPVEPEIKEETPIIVEPFIEEVIPEDELFIGNNTDDSETSKTAMQKFTEAVKRVAVVFSISLLAVLALLGLPLLILLWLKRVKVQNDQNVDEYSEEENWKTVYKTKAKTEGNVVAELKKDNDRVWKISIPESVITERTTDYFQIVLKKRFCKRYNGEEIVVILESENDANVKNLVFVIDEKDNTIKFTVE